MRNLENVQADLTACIQMIVMTIGGAESYTALRQYVLKLAIEIITSSSFIEEKESLKITSTLKYEVFITLLYFMLLILCTSVGV